MTANKRMSLASLIGFMALLTVVSVEAQPKSPLTEQQVLALIDNKTVDLVIAQSISERHLAFTPTRYWVEGLRQRGTGVRTLEALTVFAIDTTLAITTNPPEPECEVVVDGIPRTRTDKEGRATISDLGPSTHTVVIRRPPNYGDHDYMVDLRRGPYHLTAALRFAKSQLTVIVNVPRANIVIGGIGQYRGTARNVECSPGTYTVTVSAPSYRPFTRQAVVPPGDNIEITVELEYDDLARKEVLAQGQQALRTRAYGTAIQSAAGVLSSRPDDAEALALLAEANYLSGAFDKAALYAAQAIEKGGAVGLAVYHHHVVALSHPAVIIISASALQFEANPDGTGADCPLMHTRLPLAALVESNIIHNNQGGILLNLRVHDPQKTSKLVTINLGDYNARVVAQMRTLNSNHNLAPGPNAQTALGVINELLKHRRS